MKKEFYKYIVPSMISFLFSGIYVSIDGLFVGQAVGDIGLAAINIAWPLAAVIMASGTGIGMGGAVNISNHTGAGEKDKADKALGNTLTLLLIASAALTVSLLLGAKPLLRLMGAEGDVLELAYDYIRVLGMGSVLQVLGTGLTPLLRNQDKAWLAMVLMVSNFVVDTVLSGIFVMVLGYDVTGAAGASLLGQLLPIIPALMFLFKKERRISTSHYKLNRTIVHHILNVGAPIFGLTFIPSFTILIINRQSITYGGTSAVAAFAIISYVLSVGQLLLQGVGEGSQPLISFYHGANNQNAVTQLRRWTYNTALVIGIIATIGIIALRNVIPIIFNVSEDATDILQVALPLCTLSLPLYAFSRVTTEYFNATKRSRNAAIMVYGEAVVVLPICALTLPLVLKLNGVWAALTMAQFILLLVGIFLRRKSRMTTRPDYFY